MIRNLLFIFAMMLWGCSNPASKHAEDIIAHQTPNVQAELKARQLKPGAPVFIRIIKSTSGEERDGRLELFVQNDGETFEPYKVWPICYYSGELRPKLKEGDLQSPEGFYFVRPSQMNPNSQYHPSFNLGYPNAYDRAHGRTGSYLMVHGDCVSIGCYAMTDPVIEEIYTIMSAAYEAGQPFIRVHAFPFEMTDENMEKFAQHEDINFWRNLKQGWDYFEENGQPPNVEVENAQYIFSAP